MYTRSLTKFLLCYFTVINKDVTTEEVQRVDDLVTYLEGQDSETGLQKQVLLLIVLLYNSSRQSLILPIVMVPKHATIGLL